MSNIQDNRNKLLSIIVPVYNEQSSINPFLISLNESLNSIGIDIEILFIDDGSTDETFKEIKKHKAQDARIRCVKLARNFGKEAAMTAGLDYAQGDAVIPIDVDLQDPPHLIQEFVRYWREGYDTVYGMRANREEDGRSKRASAGLFYYLFNKLSPTPIPENTGDYRLMSRRVVDAVKEMPERNRFMKGLFAWPGYPSIGIKYDRPARFTGKTKWNFWKLWNFALDGLTSFTTWPLRVWSYVGITISAISLIYMTVIVIRTAILGVDMPGYASLMSVILFLGSIQLISIGVLGEYIGRVYFECKKRPIYFVEEYSNEDIEV